MGVVLAEVRNAPVAPSELFDLVSRPDAGAVAQFVGVVRDHDPQASGAVVALDYTCHPSAQERMGEIVAAVLASADPADGCVVAAVHRIGHLVVGDVAFVVTVSSPHRRLAFAVCAQVVEAVKADLPVWKQQFEADGSYRWSGL
ncbi:MAG: molybdenum cofactor biosynthesis protein MoaE [Propionibacteriaceae bacterium]|nr:molybdenum cofactor biosynthesis protein MoaE [Propionibacteriaceae bacterium]